MENSIVNSDFTLEVINCDSINISYDFHDLFDFMHSIDGEGIGVPMLDDTVTSIVVNGVFPFNPENIKTVKDLYKFARGMWNLLDELD